MASGASDRDARYSLRYWKMQWGYFSRLLGVACEDREGLTDNLSDTTLPILTADIPPSANKSDVTKMIRKNRSWRIEKQIGKNNINRDASNIYILYKSNIDAEKRYARVITYER